MRWPSSSALRTGSSGSIPTRRVRTSHRRRAGWRRRSRTAMPSPAETGCRQCTRWPRQSPQGGSRGCFKERNDMKFENRFSVKAPIDDVWETLLDVERVAPCLPGAKVLERTGEDEYIVAMRVKVGPITMEYKGDVKIFEKDDAAHRAVLK